MDIELIGRHALLFDDNPTAEFVNSKEALVEWNSLLIDRFDVRHLLTSLPRCKLRRDYLTRSPSPPLLPDGSSEADLYHEHYLDLPPLTDERVQGVDGDAGPINVGGIVLLPFHMKILMNLPICPPVKRISILCIRKRTGAALMMDIGPLKKSASITVLPMMSLHLTKGNSIVITGISMKAPLMMISSTLDVRISMLALLVRSTGIEADHLSTGNLI